MPLITTINQFRKYYARLSANYTFVNLEGLITECEEKYIIPIIGQDFYDELVDAIAASELTEEPIDLSAEEAKLVEKLRRSLVFFCLLEGFSSLGVQVGSAGTGQGTSNTTQPLPQWKEVMIKCEFADKAELFLDQSLLYLENHKDDFSTWAESDQYTVSKELFINTAEQLTVWVPLFNSRRAYLALRPFLKLVQTETIPSTIGRELYDSLLANILANSLSDEEKTLVDNIAKAIANIACRKAFSQLAIAYNGNGFRILSDNDTITQKLGLPVEKLTPVYTDFTNEGNITLTALKQYLEDNAADWPTYKSSTAYIGPSQNLHHMPDNSCKKSFTL